MYIKDEINENTFGGRLRKSRLDKNLDIKDLSSICNVTNSIISAYEVGRYYPSISILKLLSEYFDINYLCRDGYTHLVWNYDNFINSLKLWIKNNNFTMDKSAKLLGVTHGSLRFWFNGSIMSYATYNKIKNNLIYYRIKY
ncbi:helix-turn-helix domain-containing protein [Romboutsia sp. 1001713B170207_170306_H8]|uniref:helix-turn-helix domain-containing protein n=1 Tax=Romboutsia sp. 1001713B170207_170306_H8 TaxID=2787112 RepID=UPI00189BD9DD|nr:helix-turn-helix transcriptional regulator [Romboutsia sp. 1001713B170207_170306_H8]